MDFTPSENQLKVLTAIQDTEYSATVMDVCKRAGITSQAYYKWFQNEAFREWWQAELDRFFALRRSRVIAAIYQAAISEKPQPRGSTTDRRLFLERYDKGYMPKSKRELEHRGPVPVDLSQMSQEELLRMAHACGVKEPGEAPTDGD